MTTDERDQPTRPEPIPHVRMYCAAAALVVLAAAALVIALTEPAVRGMQATAVTLACIASILIATTAQLHRMQRNADVIHHDLSAIITTLAELAKKQDSLHLKQDSLHVRMQAALESLGLLGYDVGRGVAFAEQIAGTLRTITSLLDLLVTQDMADQDVRRQVAEMHRMISSLGTDANANNVLPLPSPETRAAAQRLVRRVIREEEEGRG